MKSASDIFSPRKIRWLYACRIRLCAAVILVLLSFRPAGGAIPVVEGIQTAEIEQLLSERVARQMDSLLEKSLGGETQRPVYNQISRIIPFKNEALDFYLLLFLIMIPGVIRWAFPKYYRGLWQMVRNASAAKLQWKDRIQGAMVPNALMNVFFVLSATAYLYYVIQYLSPGLRREMPPAVQLALLAGGLALVYLTKYGVMRLTGWLFRIQQVTGSYLFNVFFVGKLLALVLLPFTILLAFGDPEWQLSTLIISGIIACMLMISRYIRSWEVFGIFFQYSRFHFFLYLCASEILPLAVLIKLLMKGVFMDQ